MDFFVLNSVVRIRAILFIIFFSFLFKSNSQNRISLDTINNTVYIGEFKFKTPSSIISNYVYDEKLDLYIYQSKIGDLEFDIPLTLKPEEYRNLFRSNFIKEYFSEQLNIIQDPNKVEEAINLFDIKKDATALRSLHLMSESAYKTFEITIKGELKSFASENNDLDKSNIARQQFPKTYLPNGYVDVLSIF